MSSTPNHRSASPSIVPQFIRSMYAGKNPLNHPRTAHTVSTHRFPRSTWTPAFRFPSLKRAATDAANRITIIASREGSPDELPNSSAAPAKPAYSTVANHVAPRSSANIPTPCHVGVHDPCQPSASSLHPVRPASATDQSLSASIDWVILTKKYRLANMKIAQ
jgi:hypothetical protein